jgi:hypothetical protein
MAVTTREYNIAQATPAQVIRSVELALTDLGWMDSVALGYMLTFSNTSGGIVAAEVNQRYLVNPSASTGPGTKAVFDVLRSITGAVSTVTLVTGGSGYRLFAVGGITTSTAVITGLASTANMSAGMAVTKVSGTGTLPTNCIIASVDSGSQITLSSAPTVALSSAVLQFADVCTISAASIGGSTYSKAGTTGVAGQSTITVTSNTGITVGQLVTGTNIGPRAAVTAVSGLTITLSVANLGTVNTTVMFSDEISVMITGIANATDLAGTASGLTITNVLTNANIYVGALVTITGGSPTLPGGSGFDAGQAYIASITGSGPYTITLTNKFGSCPGFTGTGSITFSAMQGSSSQFFDCDVYTTPLTSAWGIAKVTNNAAKKLGTTFWIFYAAVTTATHLPTGGVATTLYVRSCPGFNPSSNVVQGVAALDYHNTSAVASTTPYNIGIVVASNTQIPIMLRTRQSAVDPNFATWSFFEGSNNNRNPFYLSKYDTIYQPWSLDDVFLGGAYEVFCSQAFNTSDAGINLRTRMGGIPKRQAESGYSNYNQATGVVYSNTFFRTNSGNRQLATPSAVYDDISLYSRTEGDLQKGVATVAVYKNVPICVYFAPVPYYLPADIVIAEVPFANANVGDTLTVGPSEVYTVVQSSVNQTTYSSMVLAARTT